ncbi:hypothetical protein CQA53_00400 [Helicobacter didelphidarum]|uniref:Outer membrane protein beta-barrel domain-containing protein n=1 Tax=Helicobacter didelphidarum TaxID=2040648 RepID=A0A3D8IQQ8_9HELI|nr:hypothetical protein [Helicobacter didelphidarum]RDU67522.1 hypothetical protein CQA53_00400 [Helicobacter didelphidarum]
MLMVYKKYKIALIFLLFYTHQYAIAQNYGGNYDWRMIGGGPLQLVSFHVGSSTSITHNGDTGYSLGVSVGWNYFSAFYGVFDNIEHVFDMGMRVKYNFNHNVIKSHLVGAELYLHFPYSTTNIFAKFPQPFSLILGGGGIFVYPDSKASRADIHGYYVETGIGIAKFFIVNVNLLYRWSFFPSGVSQGNAIGLQPIEQSFHVEFAIF